MNPTDYSANHEDNGDDRTSVDLFVLPDAEIEAGWQLFQQRHIDPGDLFQLAIGATQPTDADLHHLEWCASCKAAYDAYGSAPAVSSDRPHTAMGNRQQQFWDERPAPRCNGQHLSVGISPSQDARPVDPLLRTHFHVQAPIVFPDDQVAFESWQFGRILQLVRDDHVLADQLLDLIADEIKRVLLRELTPAKLMLVCYGRAMHRCGTRVAAQFAGTTHRTPHVVLAHDFYSPTLVCDPKEFQNADVVILADVVHTGGTLDKLMSLCVDNHPRSVRGLALVDQSGGVSLCADWYAVWTEDRETRLSLDQFLKRATPRDIERLRRFEPNDECAVAYTAAEAPARLVTIGDCIAPLGPELLTHIHVTDALKCDHTIGKKRYPYVINVLDLLKKDKNANQFVLNRATKELSDVADGTVCIAYHSGRAARAGQIAKMLGRHLGWPVVAIGTRGTTFALTNQQFKTLARYDTVIVVDAAIRTGETISAIARAIDDRWLRKHTKIIAFCILDAMTDRSQADLASELDISIRTLFKLPLAPPTEEVRHWANVQKSLIHERMSKSGAFAKIEQALGTYCQPIKVRFARTPPAQSVAETKERIQHAIYDGRTPEQGLKEIDAACREGKPRFIRHLSLDEVVQDRSIQSLLTGIMFNSMKPSFKESAAFALAAARNYEWMTLDWLKCNRPFLSSHSNGWKAILMVECQMQLNGRTEELAQFRDAALQFRDEVSSHSSHKRKLSKSQLVLNLAHEGMEVTNEVQQEKSQAAKDRIAERVTALIDAAR